LVKYRPPKSGDKRSSRFATEEDIMKCFIEGKEVQAKTTENLGWTEHGYARAVEYNGKEYIVVKNGGT
jgi:hypothetical protein